MMVIYQDPILYVALELVKKVCGGWVVGGGGVQTYFSVKVKL